MKRSVWPLVLLAAVLTATQTKATGALEINFRTLGSIINSIFNSISNCLFGGHFTNLRVLHIGHSWINLTWDEEVDNVSASCNGSVIVTFIKTSCNISVSVPYEEYNCTLVDNSDNFSSNPFTFTPGIGSVTTHSGNSFDNVLALFKDEVDRVIDCIVMNDNIQTDTVWSIENYKGIKARQNIMNDDTFQISRVQHNLADSDSVFNYGSSLKIPDCSLNDLDGARIHCGSYADPTQVHFEIKICEMPDIKMNKIICAEEGDELYKVTVILTNLPTKNLTLWKNGEEINDRDNISKGNHTIAFKEVTRYHAGNYFWEACIYCHEKDDPHCFSGNFTLEVIYGPSITEDQQIVYEVREGDQANLTCGHNLESYPTATITWTNPHKQQISNNDKYSIKNGPDLVQLIIADVSNKSDSGEWQCNMKILKNSTEEEDQIINRTTTVNLQLRVVVPPSEPRDLHVDEIGSESAVYVHWSQPLHNGSCRIRYKLCFDGNSRVRSIVLDKTSYKLELVEDEIFTFTVYAISQCETVSAKSSPSNFTFAMDFPHNFEAIDIGLNWVYLSWEELLVSNGHLKQSYRVTCKNDTVLNFITEKTSYNVTGLLPNVKYGCTVIAVSGDNWSISRHSQSWTIIPGTGLINGDSDSKVIAHFIDEGESLNLSCAVTFMYGENYSIQTDTIWSIENYYPNQTEDLPTIKNDTIFLVSGNQRSSISGSESHYGNNLMISDCSRIELNEAIVYCGSHAAPKQVQYKFKVCDIPRPIKLGIIWLKEGTEECPVTLSSQYDLTTVSNPTWEKIGDKINNPDISYDGCTISFKNINRNHTGSYSLASVLSCHKKSRNFNETVEVKVIHGPNISRGKTEYSTRIGSSVSLICGYNLTSNPPAIITWIDPKNKTVANDTKYFIINEPEEVKLNINNVSNYDDGYWRCIIQENSSNLKPFCGVPDEDMAKIDTKIQLAVVSPPSEPKNLHVVEANSSSIRVCWEKPKDHGTPNLAGYKLFNSYTNEEFDMTNCTNVTCADVSHIVKQNTTKLNMTVVAFSESEQSLHSNSVVFIMDYPRGFKTVDVCLSEASFSWSKLNSSDELSQLQYNVTCNGSSFSSKDTNISILATLAQQTTYECTVVAILGNSIYSLHSDPLFIIPGAGKVTEIQVNDRIVTAQNNTLVIAHFDDEQEQCSHKLSCKVLYMINNSTVQTDTVWKAKRNTGETIDIINNEMFQVSGSLRETITRCDSNYGNHLTINDCSQITIHCGSLVDEDQATFKFEVCESPLVMKNEIIRILEGTDQCQLTLIQTNLTSGPIVWEGEAEKKTITEKFNITFGNVRRADHGNYSVESPIICFDKSKNFTGSITLDVLYGPILSQVKGRHNAIEGDSVSLVCGKNLESNPNASITWINPQSTSMSGSNDDNYAQDDGPEVVQLNIAKASKRDSGTWTCVMTSKFCLYNCTLRKCINKTQTSNVSIALNVFYGPHIKEEGHNVQYSNENENKSIICAKGIESHPPANITWTYPNGTSVKNNGRYFLKNKPDIELTIANMSSSDNGTWRCTILVQNGDHVIGKKEILIDHIVYNTIDATDPHTKIIKIIIITIILGLVMAYYAARLTIRKASKPTVSSVSQECAAGARSETTVVQPHTTDKIITKPDTDKVAHKSIAETSEEISTQSLAELLKKQSTKTITKDTEPDIYHPKFTVFDDKISKIIVADSPSELVNESQAPIDERILMLVGATGAGKSTLINGIVNYIMGVKWQNKFRFKLIFDGERKSQAHSQTSKITMYSFPTSCLPYTLTVIDTPGFGDTRGIENDKAIMEQIKMLFSCGGPNSIDQIHGVGFVIQASSPRLTPTMKYTFDSILSIFGKNIVSNIFLLITFTDSETPPVLSAVKEADIPYHAYFRFNNSALYSNQSDDEFSEMFWNLGNTSFEHFFSEFKNVEPHSLNLTRENLSNRQQLETISEGLKMQIRVVIAKIDMLRQKRRILRKREAEILQNQHFSYELTITKQRQVKLQSGVFVTNCRQCDFTCHFPCPISKDQEKYRCKVMDGGGPDSAHCTVCPGNCQWSQHVNASHRFVTYYEVETQTSDDLKKNLSEAISGKNQIESMISDIEEELNMLQGVIMGMVCEAKRSLERLQEIALRPNPLSEIEYINVLIKAENSEKSPGFTERIKAFEMIKDIIKKQGAVASEKKMDSVWWKNIMTRK